MTGRPNACFFLIFWFCLGWLGAGTGQAQTKEELQEQRKALLKEIKLTQKLISRANEKQQSSLNYLQLLQKKVGRRKQLILNLRQEIQLTSNEIDASDDVVEALQKDLKRVQDNYAELIRYAYRNREGQDGLLFLLSSKSFFQLYERLRYLQYYSRFRVRQLEIIEQTRASLSSQVARLRDQRAAKRSLLEDLNTEVESLVQDQQAQRESLSQLKDKKARLRAQLEEDRKQAGDLEQAIEDILAREMRKRREEERRRNAADRKATADRKTLSSSFAANKGALPWPVKEGVISSDFGIHNHPTLKGVEVKNNGVDITVEKDATAYAVFGGEVLAVFAIPGSGEGVLIQHGDYFTLYSNLAKVFVKSGSTVDLEDALGKISTNPQTGATELHFEVYRNADVQNPRKWIKQL